jgi:hypothetical protein
MENIRPEVALCGRRRYISGSQFPEKYQSF